MIIITVDDRSTVFSIGGKKLYQMLQRNRFFLIAILAFVLAVCIPARSANSAEQTYLFRIVQLSDSQPTNEVQWQRMAEVVDLVNRLKPNAIRFMPPLIVGNAEVDEALGILDKALSTIV